MKVTCRACKTEVELPEGINSGFCSECGKAVTAEAVNSVADTINPTADTVPPAAEAVNPTADTIYPTADTATPTADSINPAADTINSTNVVNLTKPPVEPIIPPEAVINPIPPTPPTPETPPIPPTPPTPEAFAPVYEKPVAVKRKLPIAIIAAVAAVLAVGGVVAAALFGAFGNGTYKSAEKAGLDGIRAISAFTDLAKAADTSGRRYDFDFTYEIPEEITSSIGFDEMGIDSVNAVGFVAEKDGEYLSDTSLTLGEIAFDVIAAMDEENASISLPSITDYYMSFAAETEDGDDLVLDREALAKTLDNIEEEYFALTDRIGVVTEGVDVTGGDITVKADEYVFEFTYQDIYDLLYFSIDEIRDNENLSEYVFARAGIIAYGTETADDFWDEIEDNLDSLYEYDYDDDKMDETMFRMTALVYKNFIVSRTIDRINGEAGNSISYDILFNTQSAYFKAAVKEDGDTVMKMTGEAARDGSLWNGELKMTVDDGTAMKITGENITYKDEIATGQVKFKSTYDDETTMEINVDLSEEDGEQLLEADGSYYEYDLGYLRLKSSTEDIDTLTLPEFDPDFGIDMNNYYDDEEMYERYMNFQNDVDEFFSQYR
jgi:hypothetical protein